MPCKSEDSQEVIPMTIELSWATVIYFCTCIITVGGALKVLNEANKALKKPLEEVKQKLDHYDHCLDNDKKHLDKIDYALGDLTNSINMLVKSNRTILYHLEEGNHSGEIRDELRDIDNWLIQKNQYQK